MLLLLLSSIHGWILFFDVIFLSLHIPATSRNKTSLAIDMDHHLKKNLKSLIDMYLLDTLFPWL